MWKIIAEKAAKPRINMIKLRKTMVSGRERGVGWLKFNIVAARPARVDINVITESVIRVAIAQLKTPAKR